MRAATRCTTAVLVVLLVALLPGAVAAHTGLESSDPADGSSVDGPLEAIVLQFTGTPTAIDDGIAVADADGTRYEPVEVVQDGLTITARFAPPLGAGSYAASWVVRSDDTHTISGTLTFAVTAPPPTTTAPTTTVAPATTAAGSTTAPAVAAPTSTAGAAPTTVAEASAPPDDGSEGETTPVVAAPPPPPAAAEIDDGRSVARIGRLVLFPSAVVAVGILAFAATTFAGRRDEMGALLRLVRWLGVGVAFGAILELVGLESVFGGYGDLLESGAGRAALARSVAGVLLVVGVGFTVTPRPRALSSAVLEGGAPPAAAERDARWHPASHPLAVVAVVLLVGSFAFDGHTASEGPRVVHAAASITHVAAASVWAGGVVALAVVLWHRHRDRVATRAVEMIVRFSVSAMVALAVAGLAGVVMAWFIEDDLGAYTSTEWGRLMLAKLALVAIAAGLGAYNHFRIMPDLEAASDDPAVLGRARTSVTIEAALLVGAALLTAVLVGASTL